MALFLRPTLLAGALLALQGCAGTPAAKRDPVPVPFPAAQSPAQKPEQDRTRWLDEWLKLWDESTAGRYRQLSAQPDCKPGEGPCLFRRVLRLNVPRASRQELEAARLLLSDLAGVEPQPLDPGVLDLMLVLNTQWLDAMTLQERLVQQMQAAETLKNQLAKEKDKTTEARLKNDLTRRELMQAQEALRHLQSEHAELTERYERLKAVETGLPASPQPPQPR